MSAYVRTICYIAFLFAWCGGLWSCVLAAKQLHAAGNSIWTLNTRARLNAWKGANIVLFLSCSAVGAAAILTAIAVR
ncbi:hypothetical protein ABID59_007308 [Bradyrhizobium sp. S3.3.6]